MIQKVISDLKAANPLQLSLFLIFGAVIVGYGLLHAGLIKLPPAKAYDCSQISNPKNIQINVDKQGFHPNKVKVTVCDTLIFTSTDGLGPWPAIGPHPTHSSYPGFDSLKALAQGESFKFLVNRPGTYSFHDHLHINLTGVLSISPP